MVAEKIVLACIFFIAAVVTSEQIKTPELQSLYTALVFCMAAFFSLLTVR